MTTFARILLAVDDSPAALAAARVALDLATATGAVVRAVTVAEDGTIAATLDEIAPGSDARSRLGEAATAMLEHVTRLAASTEVPLEKALLVGEPFRSILGDARDWQADLIVMGRSDRKGPASPYVGSEVAHVLEFCDIPVLVVPAVR